MQNIILLGIDISLDNWVPLLRNFCVCEILDFRNILVVVDMAYPASLLFKELFLFGT